MSSYTNMNAIIFLLFVFGICLPTIYSRHVQFYRKDYTYIEEFDAFYKIHGDVNGSAWSTALFTCEDEGAVLFYPKAQGEWTVVKNLTDKIKKDKRRNVTDIFVGLQDEFGHSTADSVPSDSNFLPEPLHENCMTMNIDSGSIQVSSCLRTPRTELPFVCKKVDDESCPTIDQSYKYMKASRKCYKVNEKPQKWEEAMKTCFLEGGILAVIEDNTEAFDIQSMITGSLSYFVGVRRLDSRDDYYTVKGQKFRDVYQKPYDTYSFDCGAVFIYNGMLYTKTINCEETAQFVCEMGLDRIAA